MRVHCKSLLVMEGRAFEGLTRFADFLRDFHAKLVRGLKWEA